MNPGNPWSRPGLPADPARPPRAIAATRARWACSTASGASNPRRSHSRVSHRLDCPIRPLPTRLRPGRVHCERGARRVRVKDPLNFRLPTLGAPRAQIWGDRRKLRTAALKRSDPSTSHR